MHDIIEHYGKVVIALAGVLAAIDASRPNQ